MTPEGFWDDGARESPPETCDLAMALVWAGWDVRPMSLPRTRRPETWYLVGMSVALAAVAFVALFVVMGGVALAFLHRALRATEILARSATALRELEPRGGRHRFHTRLFEAVALASACISGLGVLLIYAAAPEAEPALPMVGGGAVGVAVWWAWRRGSLRAVEAEPIGESSSSVGSQGRV